MYPFPFFILAILLFFYPSRIFSENGKVIHLYNYAHYMPEDVLNSFEKETGIKVKCHFFDNQETLSVMLISGAAYDVVVAPAWPTYAQSLKNENFQPLNPHILENKKGIDPWFYQQLKDIDPTLRYGVPYMWGTTGIGYDSSLPQAVQSKTNSWSLCFDLQTVQHLKKEKKRIYLMDSPSDVLQAVLIYLGYCPTSFQQDHWDHALHHLSQIAPFIFTFESGRQTENFLDGNANVIQIYSTYGNMARKEALDMGKTLTYCVPKEGCVMWIDMLAIPRNAPNPKEANIFINFLLRPDIAARLSIGVQAFNGIPDSERYMTPQQVKELRPNAQLFQRCYPDAILPPDLLRHISRQWMKFLMGISPRLPKHLEKKSFSTPPKTSPSASLMKKI